MSKMSELVLEIQEMAHDMGDDFGFESSTIKTIARALNVPEDLVIGALEQVPDYEDVDCDDSDDGYALASAGFGMDEDYGSFSDDY